MKVRGPNGIDDPDDPVVWECSSGLRPDGRFTHEFTTRCRQDWLRTHAYFGHARHVRGADRRSWGNLASRFRGREAKTKVQRGPLFLKAVEGSAVKH
jgi:hypothetical protein